jgi:hypothetical protein
LFQQRILTLSNVIVTSFVLNYCGLQSAEAREFLSGEASPCRSCNDFVPGVATESAAWTIRLKTMTALNGVCCLIRSAKKTDRNVRMSIAVGLRAAAIIASARELLPAAISQFRKSP